MSARTAFHIALLSVATYMIDRSSTAPNPPPKEDEMRQDINPAERFFSKVSRATGAGCTAAVLIAREYPSELNTAVLQKLLLVGTGAAAHIQLTPYVLAGFGLTMLGSAIRLVCFRTLDRFFTFEMTVKEDHQLCTRGPYSVVRHPAYAGYWVQTAGIALWNCCAGSWAREAGWLGTPAGMAMAGVFLGLQAYAGLSMIMRCSQEDALMRMRFGGLWDEWANRVPHRLVPFVY
ncbi:hypothetical protein DAEQUDRAFT_810447 [Daedalea quercina L-15889]|uniref:Protein-S-isoprenylcysteine O-methyltransferase n=1 Tax=Daedalea quercina L-15889 TaxID=1314783 RepID=A0A165RKF9_9APHY|nr:hypothetical protein DAEQUDRAFT_810447 [Daedalea quercina L-15889]